MRKRRAARWILICLVAGLLCGVPEPARSDPGMDEIAVQSESETAESILAEESSSAEESTAEADQATEREPETETGSEAETAETESSVQESEEERPGLPEETSGEEPVPSASGDPGPSGAWASESEQTTGSEPVEEEKETTDQKSSTDWAETEAKRNGKKKDGKRSKKQRSPDRKRDFRDKTQKKQGSTPWVTHEAVLPPETFTEYRFTQVDAEKALLPSGEMMRTAMEDRAPAAGKAEESAVVSILKRSGDWAFVEAGYVRGFVRNEVLEPSGSLPEKSGLVKEMIPHMDNPAFSYTRTTAMEVTVKKVYGIADRELKVFDDIATAIRNGQGSGQVTGILPEGGLCYILSDLGRTVFVESGTVRGFVLKDDLTLGDAAVKKVRTIGETKMAVAEEKIAPEKNRALYYTVTSVRSAKENLREAVVNYALQFVGNRYVWGGTSLTNGTDCSGFTMSVYAAYGFSLPRTSLEQRSFGGYVGTDLSRALPGDLICFDGHVGLYIGDGKMVHAANRRSGIKVSGVHGTILAIRRVIV